MEIVCACKVFDRSPIACRHLPIVNESRFCVRCSNRRASMVGYFRSVSGIVKNADLGNFALKHLAGVKAAASAVLLLAEDKRAAGF